MDKKVSGKARYEKIKADSIMNKMRQSWLR